MKRTERGEAGSFSRRPLRLFIAVDVPASVRAEAHAATASLRAAEPQWRWNDPARWHLTLAFLAAVEVARLDAVAEAMRAAASEVAPFELALNGRAGSFPGVVWAALEPNPELRDLAERLRRRLEPLGYADDRPFRAHLTLARSRRRTDRRVAALAATYRGPTSAWLVDRVVLWQSRLQATGAVHVVLSQAGLGETRVVEPPQKSN